VGDYTKIKREIKRWTLRDLEARRTETEERAREVEARFGVVGSHSTELREEHRAAGYANRGISTLCEEFVALSADRAGVGPDTTVKELQGLLDAAGKQRLEGAVSMAATGEAKLRGQE
jgi:hypothetical protein